MYPQPSPNPAHGGWVQIGNQYVPADTIQQSAPMSIPQAPMSVPSSIPEGYAPMSVNGQTVLTPKAQSNPSPTSKPAPAPSSGYPQDKYIGWDPVAAQNDWNAKLASGQTGGQSNQSNNLYDQEQADIQAAYDALQPVFNQQEANIRNQAGVTKEDITNATNIQKQDIQNAQTLKTQQLADERNRTALNQRSAVDTLTRDLNQLAQGYMSRLGGGSSAGGAALELVSEQYLRSKGDVLQGYRASMQKLGELEFQNTSQFQSMMAKADQEMTQQYHEVDARLEEGLLSIANARAQSEVWKREKSLQLKEQLRQELVAKENSFQDLKNQIALWKMQQDEAVKSAISYNNDIFNKTRENVTATNSSVAQSGQGLKQFSLSPEASQSAIAYRKPTDNTEDELSSLNPWEA